MAARRLRLAAVGQLRDPNYPLALGGATDHHPVFAQRDLIRSFGDRGAGLRVVPVMPDHLFDRPIRSLSALAAAEAECTRCPLYKFATQVVPGEGRRNSRLILVGEQPGDKEDIAGKPFVGPAGRILDQALADAGIPRNDVFVTNAVKHFKFEPRGKRRLHKRPNAYELQRCKWWLDHERAIIRPAAIVALGTTAGRSLFGKVMTIGRMRGAGPSARRRHPRIRHHPPVVLVTDRGQGRQDAGVPRVRRRSPAGENGREVDAQWALNIEATQDLNHKRRYARNRSDTTSVQYERTVL